MKNSLRWHQLEGRVPPTFSALEQHQRNNSIFSSSEHHPLNRALVQSPEKWVIQYILHPESVWPKQCHWNDCRSDLDKWHTRKDQRQSSLKAFDTYEPTIYPNPLKRISNQAITNNLVHFYLPSGTAMLKSANIRVRRSLLYMSAMMVGATQEYEASPIPTKPRRRMKSQKR